MLIGDGAVIVQDFVVPFPQFLLFQHLHLDIVSRFGVRLKAWLQLDIHSGLILMTLR